jgi:RHS repeat-associated protein
MTATTSSSTTVKNRAVSATNGSAAGAYVYDGNGRRVQKCLPTRLLWHAYYHRDHLSNRLVTNSSGGVLEQLGTFPFGERWYNASADKLLFTTYERDSESGNDYAQARYNNSRTGRFNSPDPVAGSISDPQSLNRYSYVRNLPVMLTDPAGLTPQCNTVKNDETQPDRDTGGGPAVTESDSDLGESDPGAPQQGPGCGSIPPWYYTIGGGGDGGGGAGGFGPGGIGSSPGSGYSFGDGGIFAFIGGGIDGGLGSMGDPFAGPFGPPDPCFGDADGSLAAVGGCGGGGGNSGGGGLFSRVRQLVQAVLDTKNDCSKFFNSMFVPSISGDFGDPMTAGDFFRTDNIAYDYGMPGQPKLPPGAAGAALSGAGAGATIWIVPNSAFDLKTFDTIGGFAAEYPGAQAELVLHELAHTLLGIPSDSKDPLQSWANTQTIDSNCYSAILAQIKSK